MRLTIYDEEKEEAKSEDRNMKENAWRRAKCTNIFKHWWYFGHFKKEDEYPWAPYDRVNYKAFLRKLRKMGRKGIDINRNYFQYFGDTFPHHFNLYQNSGRHYNHLRVFPWDSGDMDDYLIVKLTITAMFIFRYGKCVSHRAIAHEMWMAREALIKAIALVENHANPDTELAEAYRLIGQNRDRWWD